MDGLMTTLCLRGATVLAWRKQKDSMQVLTKRDRSNFCGNDRPTMKSLCAGIGPVPFCRADSAWRQLSLWYETRWQCECLPPRGPLGTRLNYHRQASSITRVATGAGEELHGVLLARQLMALARDSTDQRSQLASLLMTPHSCVAGSSDRATTALGMGRPWLGEL